jgi:ligand-binding sensor domain-containing protein
MACALTQGMVLDCKDSIGGIKAVWFIATGDVTAVAEASGVVTAITKASGKVFYKYALVKNSSSLTENVNANVQNGTVFYAQELAIVLNKMQANTRNEILLLAKNNLMAVVEDANGKYWLIGKQNGLDLSAGSSATGTAQADRNGYTLTFSGGEKELAPEVTSGIIAGLTA